MEAVIQQVRQLASPEAILDGRLVAEDLSYRSHAVLASNGTDFLVVWRQRRNGDFDLYGTRVSSSGQVLDPEGIAVSTAPGTQSLPQVVSNGTDWLVTWTDNRTGDWSIYGTRVSGTGEVSHPGGLLIPDTVALQRDVAVASNGTDYLVVWQEVDSAGSWSIYGKRLSSTGQLLQSAPIAISAEAGHDERDLAMASNGTHYLVVWVDWRDRYPRLYGKRVSNSGEVLDGTGFPLSVEYVGQGAPAVASNGTDFLVVWSDERHLSSRDLYGTRVTGAGTVLDGAGLHVASDRDLSEQQAFVTSRGADYFVTYSAWDMNRSTWQIRGTRVLGSRFAANPVVDPAGIVFSPAGEDHQLPTVAPTASGYFVTWHQNRGSEAELRSANVSATGRVEVASVGGFSLRSAPLMAPREIVIASNGSNYLVVWLEAATGAIYGTRVTREGGVLDAKGLLIGHSLRERQSPAVTSNGTDYLVAWMDFRDVNWNIYGARVSGAGPSASAVRDPSGLVISQHPAHQSQPAVGSDGTNYLVVWRQDPHSQGTLHGARVTSGGEVLDPSGIPIATAAVEHYTPQVAYNGRNYLVVWSEYAPRAGWDIHGARVSNSGVVLDPSGIAIHNGPWDQTTPSVASNGADFFVAWADYRSGNNTDIYGARVSGGGEVLDPGGLALCTESGQQYQPVVAFDGASYVTAWADFRGDAWWDLYATQVTASGAVSAADGFQVAANVRPGAHGLGMASEGRQRSLIVYSRHDTEPAQGSQRVRGRFLSL